MPATANSTFQALLQSHLSGSPPQTDPQRSNETFQSYVQRMAAQSCNPDIGATESDADYLARLAGYTPTPASAHKVWGYFTVDSGSVIKISNTHGSTVARLGIGSYGVTFNNPTNNSNYAVLFEGFSGSSATNMTSSIGYAYNQSINNFTMSTALVTSPTTLQDVTTASFVIFNS